MIRVDIDILLDFCVIDGTEYCQPMSHTLHSHLFQFVMVQLNHSLAYDLVLYYTCQPVVSTAAASRSLDGTHLEMLGYIGPALSYSRNQYTRLKTSR